MNYGHRAKFFNINKETCGYYSKIYKDLKSKGKPIPTNDLWIAATAMEHNLSVFTSDKHFKHISDLKVISTCEHLIESRDSNNHDEE